MQRHSREVRLGLVMYGGVSLAMYENGVAQELFRATRGEAGGRSGVYDLVKALIDSDIVVDVLSGASAGGINGIFLAYALANGRNFRTVADLWRNKADLLSLIRKTDDETDTSLMDSQGFYQRELEGCFEDIDKHPFGGPYESEIDLFVTGTNVYGRTFTAFDDQGHPIDVKDHRSVFMLSYRMGRKNEFDSGNIRALSKLARITSCFPVAFEPVHVAGPDDAEDPDLPDHSADTTLRRWGRLMDEAYFMDGGVLDNKPFSYTIDAIFSRLADRPVSRLLLYIEPDPEQFSKNKRIEMPTVVAAAADALVAIPGYESIAGDLQAITERNNKLVQYSELAASVRAQVADFVDSDSAKDTDCLATEDPTRVAMYVRCRLAQLRDRTLLGILKERGELRLLTNDRRHAAKVLVESFGMMTGGNNEVETLDSFDVYFRLRRLFQLVYKIHGLLSNASLAPDARTFYTDIWKSINHQIQLLEIVRYAMETVVDYAAIAIDDMAHRQAGPEAAGEKWTAVKNILHDLLLPHPLLSREDLDKSELVRAFMEDERDGMRARIQALKNVTGTTRQQAEGNLLFELDRQQRQIMRRLNPGDPVREAYCSFIIVDSYLFAMERTAGIEAKDVIRTVRISPIDAQRAFSQAPLDRKLCGNQLGHFGGFLKGSWRANDIMWGRVDAVCQLIECLVTPERIADLAQSGKASRRTAELDLAQILPGASADERLELQRDIEKLEDYAREHLTAQDVRNSRFNGFLTRLVKAAQGAIFDEEIPTVLQTAIDEQVRWNSYRMPKSGTVPFDTERQVWKTGVKKVDLAVLSFAQQELTRNIHNATPGYWRRYFEEKKYKVGEELVGEAIPTPILLEMATHSALVLQNCVTAAAGETRSQRIRDSLVYRFGLSYPVRAAYSFARFQRTAPEFAKSSITFVATLAMTLLVVGALGWDRLIHPESGFAFSTFGLLIVAPAVALFGLMILFTGVKVVWLIASAVFALLTLLLLIHLDVVTPNSSWIARWSALREFVGVLSDYRGAIAVGTLVSVVLAIPFRRMWTDIRLLIRRWAAPKPRASVAPIAGSAEPTAATNQKAAGKSR